MEKIIDVSGLTFYYEAHPVFENISFNLNRGDFTGIIGPNGSGKSTFLKLLLSLIRPVGGSIYLFGKEISQFRQWPRIGYIAQNNPFNNGFPASVFEVVAANLYARTGFLHIPSAKQKKDVYKALELAGMQDSIHTPIGSLSGGQQQRVYLARVLVNDPEILLLDEPASGMDTKSESGMYELLHKLNQDHHISIVMVTHDLSAVTKHANRLFCMGEQGMIEHDLSEGLNEKFVSRLYGRDVHIHVHPEAAHKPRQAHP